MSAEKVAVPAVAKSPASTAAPTHVTITPSFQSFLIKFQMAAASATLRIEMHPPSGAKQIYEFAYSADSTAFLVTGLTVLGTYTFGVAHVKYKADLVCNRVPARFRHFGYYLTGADYYTDYAGKTYANCNEIELRVGGSELQAIAAAEPDPNKKLWVSTTAAFFMGNGRVNPGWQASWAAIRAQAQAYPAKVLGFYIDEPYWALGLGSDQLQWWANAIKADLPNAKLLVNFAYPTLQVGSGLGAARLLRPYGALAVPKNVDYLSVDQYGIAAAQMAENVRLLTAVAAQSSNQPLFVVGQAFYKIPAAVAAGVSPSVAAVDDQHLQYTVDAMNVCLASPNVVGLLTFMYNINTDVDRGDPYENWWTAKNLPRTLALQQFFAAGVYLDM